MRRWLNQHPDEISLQRFQEGLLSEGGKQRIQLHLDGCDQCQWTLASYARLNRMLSSVPAASAPAELAEQIVVRVLAQQLVTPALIGPSRLWGVVGGLSALAIAASLVLWPLLAQAGSLTGQMTEVVKSLILGIQVVIPVVRGLYEVLEPLRYPALVSGAAMMALFAWLASRRLTSEEYTL